ncbi:hypothetical protein WOLCODRAFT_162443 [Wolfiporia cocos MD-104 SS10]|uniref:Uncharacterized protein n=1 Tax=Wolfiporia cocos (strain MD-104) TaxID=742152 RepID=A0A2H3JEG4_WOLCO|nr:hypothetical protein WOLCODRAFT_162443 [Wolfiporia cocos MD-104 SS10]
MSLGYSQRMYTRRNVDVGQLERVASYPPSRALSQAMHSENIDEDQVLDDVGEESERDELEVEPPDVGDGQSNNRETASSSHNRNPLGKNQHANCPPKDDSRVASALMEYHRRNITDRRVISVLLSQEHGIQMSPATVARRRRSLGLMASGVTTRQTPETVKRQLVADQMARDSLGRYGPRRIQKTISEETGVHLTRDWIANEMRKVDPKGFTLRHPANRKSRRQQSPT